MQTRRDGTRSTGSWDCSEYKAFPEATDERAGEGPRGRRAQWRLVVAEDGTAPEDQAVPRSRPIVLPAVQRPVPAPGTEGSGTAVERRDEGSDRDDVVVPVGRGRPRIEGGPRRPPDDDAVIHGQPDVPVEPRPVVPEPAPRLRGRETLVSVGPPTVRLPARVEDLWAEIGDRTAVRPREEEDTAVPQSVPHRSSERSTME